jgi:hypothetical protein
MHGQRHVSMTVTLQRALREPVEQDLPLLVDAAVEFPVSAQQ